MNSFLQFPVNLLQQICLIVYWRLEMTPLPSVNWFHGMKKPLPANSLEPCFHTVPAPPCRIPPYCSDHMCAPRCTCGLALKRGRASVHLPPKQQQTQQTGAVSGCREHQHPLTVAFPGPQTRPTDAKKHLEMI